ncbi:MFS transporter [Zhengella mangrovi]|uniref:MFS transporter n=1 Tax=Zhengella mangrovi TaxID=1982044 RepID=A0A2G1QKX8_9HYPH|nr:c-type cytochrome [Zhengella mangrovi]PHP66176.1 MFS transporter [Zhengella mangrovi]
MSKFLKLTLAAAALAAFSGLAHAEGDADAGKKVFNKCKACHAVGEGAKNRVGPELNELFGRTAGTAEGFKYSSAMTEAGQGGLVWNEGTIGAYLHDPKGFVPKNKMAFAGLKADEDIANVLAYLKTFSTSGGDQKSEAAPAEEPQKTEEKAAAAEPAKAAEPAAAPESADVIASKGHFGLGRQATEEEIAAWNIDVRPDGQGLPEGKGTVSDGEVLFTENCAMCHGDFGEAVGRWPVLAGGQGTLKHERPEKTVGSYWPYASTVFDYVRRAMPFGNARSLSDDDVYAIVAYILYLNDVVTDENFELSKENFTSIHLPNEENFVEDDRFSEPHYAEKKEACMKDCKPAPAEITMRARVLDVTPDAADDEENQGAGSVD